MTSEVGPAVFPTTHWSVVLTAAQGDRTPGQLALERLCQAYWPPVYAYLRRRGYSTPDAQDLAQGFFHHLLERRALASLEPARGRFRSWLLAVLKHYLGHEFEKARAQKRGGGAAHVPFEDQWLERQLSWDGARTLEPDRLYERQWAWTVLGQAAERLRTSYLAEGHAELHDQLRGYVSGEPATDAYAVVAGRLGMTEGAVKSAVYRMRQRYQRSLRDEVAQTVATPAEVDDELRHLIEVLGSS